MESGIADHLKRLSRRRKDKRSMTNGGQSREDVPIISLRSSFIVHHSSFVIHRSSFPYYPRNFFNAIVQLCPPKPSELLIATLTFCWRAWLGT
jgi:hypothetical protein